MQKNAPKAGGNFAYIWKIFRTLFRHRTGKSVQSAENLPPFLLQFPSRRGRRRRSRLKQKPGRLTLPRERLNCSAPLLPSPSFNRKGFCTIFYQQRSTSNGGDGKNGGCQKRGATNIHEFFSAPNLNFFHHFPQCSAKFWGFLAFLTAVRFFVDTQKFE